MGHFINQSLVFIGAAIIFVPLFYRFGLGAILGYLAGGILVGPSGLGLIKNSESVLHFAELGVVLLLFVIGLEMQPHKLWQMRKKLLSLGLLQVLSCSIVFSVIGILAGLETKTSLLIGFGLSLSSTAFALQNLMEKNEFNTEFGQNAFSILLTQDLMAIPALAIIPIIFSSKLSGNSSDVKLIYFPLILLGLSISSRYLLKPLFRIVAKTKTKEIFTATSLFIVLGVSSLMVEVGLSAALGTFIAGVLLADSEYRHELEADIEPFKSLLMGLFFMAVGMGVSLEVILARPVFIFILSFGYFFLKWGVIYLVGRMSKMSHENSRLMSLSIAQGGEFAFVIFTMGLGLGTLSHEQAGTLTAVVTISMMISAIMNFLNEKYYSKHKTVVEPQYDQFSESSSVIIAGFGRFGQIFGRVLRSQKIPFVAIDHDSDQIELLRKFGNKVYYGDATREDLLISAGIKSAKYLVIAIDDLDASVKVAKFVSEHFPHIKIFARARNRGHAFDFLDIGVQKIKRETFDSSINFVGELLVDMGFEKERAINIVRRFKAHDEVMLQEQYKVREDDKMFVDVSKQAVAQLEKVLDEDSQRSYIAPLENTSINS